MRRDYYEEMTVDSDDPLFEAGYDHVEHAAERADGRHGSAPWWYGWAVREAFWAGAIWQREMHRLFESECTCAEDRDNIQEEWVADAYECPACIAKRVMNSTGPETGDAEESQA